MKINKKDARLRRAKKTRLAMREHEVVRLCVHRTSQHIYAQVISKDGANVIVSASSLDKNIRSNAKSTGNVETAKLVGELVAKRALDAGLSKVSFDRSGFNFHGRIKALADAAREAGLQF